MSAHETAALMQLLLLLDLACTHAHTPGLAPALARDPGGRFCWHPFSCFGCQPSLAALSPPRRPRF
ncbi:hypothetical protein EON66_02990 [archaeon]|nr:MAG: hypothetical protein EON66_02990 [archaeon]